MSTLVLGSEYKLDDQACLVVRIIKSQSIFEDDSGVEQIDELYVELKRPDGSPEFISLMKNSTKFTEKKSNIRALDPVWRPK